MSQERLVKGKQADNILGHFLLAGIVLIEALLTLFKLLLRLKKHSSESSVDDKEVITQQRGEISLRSDEELRSALQSVEFISTLSRTKLIDLVLSNKKAQSKLLIQTREKELLRMSNEELKSMLQGVEKVSRLKKSQLVEVILSKEFDLQ